MQKDTIKQKLVHGDLKTIAKLTGFSKAYVVKIFTPGDKRTNKLIEATAVKLIEMREQIAAGIEAQNINIPQD